MLRATFESLLDAVPAFANVLLVVVGAVAGRSAGAPPSATSPSFVYLFTLLVWPLRIIGFVLGDLPHSLAGWDRVQGMLREPVPTRRARPSSRRARASASSSTASRFAYEPGRAILPASTSSCPPAPLWPSSVRPRRASPRSSPSSPGWSTPAAGTVAVEAGERCLVFQEPFLFADSMRDNITRGRSSRRPT